MQLTTVYDKVPSAFSGDGKDSANGESCKRSSATRMVTRLRNPESKLSQLKNQQVAAAVHEANKGFKEGKEVGAMEEDSALSDNIAQGLKQEHWPGQCL